MSPKTLAKRAATVGAFAFLALGVARAAAPGRAVSIDNFTFNPRPGL